MSKESIRKVRGRVGNEILEKVSSIKSIKNDHQTPSARERDVADWEVELAAQQAVEADHEARAAALDMRRPPLAAARDAPPSPPYRRGRLHPAWGSPGVGRPTHHRSSSRMGGEGQVAAAIS